ANDGEVNGYRYRPGLWPLVDKIREQTKVGSENSDLVAFAIDPLGNFFYVVDKANNQLKIYWINTNSGILVPAKQSTLAVGEQPVDVAVHPGGNWTYVLNEGDASLHVYKTNTQYGSLESLVQTVDTQKAPASFMVDAAGEYLFIHYKNLNKLSVFAIDAASGQLKPIKTLALEKAIDGMAIDKHIF
ncbi:lactonase family protein, partial [Kaarinaea lacus]